MSDTTASLSSRFPDASVLTDLVDQLKSNMGGVQSPDIPGGPIQDLTAALHIEIPDTSNWHTALPDDAKNLAKDFPSAADLTTPITEPIAKVSSLLSFDFAGSAQRFATGPAGPVSAAAPESIITPLAALVDGTVNLLQDPELASLLGVISNVTGSAEVNQIPEYAQKAGNAVHSILHDVIEPVTVAFFSLLAGMNSLSRLQLGVSHVSGAFSLDDTAKRLQTTLDAYAAVATQAGSANPAALQTSIDAAQAALQQYITNLVRDLAFTEASLAALGTSDVEATFAEIQASLAKLEPQALNKLGAVLTAEIQKAAGSMTFDASLDMAKYKQLIQTGLAQVHTEIDKLDPSGLVTGIQNGINVVVSPLAKLEQFKTQVETIIRGAFQTVRDVVQKIDLSVLRNTVEVALAAIETVLKQLAKAFADVRSTIQSAIDTVKSVLGSAKSFVLDPETGLKKKIEDVFHSINAVLDALNIQQVVAEVTATIQPISAALAKIEFAPIIKAVLDAINAITTVLKTVAPLLVTDALKEKLGQATDFLKQLDFNQIADTVNQGFTEILSSVDQDALGAFKAEYDNVVQSLAKFDPAPALEAVQTEVFDPLVAELEKVHPSEILKPLQDAFNEANSTLGKFDPVSTLSFMTDFFKSVIAQIDALSPDKMLQPIEKTLDEVRNQIIAFLHLDEIIAMIGKARAFVQPLLDRIDLDPLFAGINTGYARLKDEVANFDFNEVISFIGGKGSSGLGMTIEVLLSDSADLTPRFTGIQSDLQRGNDQLSGFDAQAALDALRSKYAAIGVAAGGNASIQVLDPMAALAPLLPKIDRVKSAFAAKVPQFSQTGSKIAPALQALNGVLPALRELMSPLKMLQEFLLEPLRRLFPGHTFTGVKDVLVQFLNDLDPAALEAGIRPILETIVAKLKAVIDDAVFNPVTQALQKVESAFDVLNIHPLVDAIDGVFRDVEGAVKALDPTPVIQEIGQKYQEIVALLRQLNPAQFIQEIADIYNNDILAVVHAISPRDLLLPPLRDLFQKISGALGAFDIEALFKPVLDRLKTLDSELTDGLNQTGAAYTQMLGVLSSAAGSGSASASVSV
jgi:hypothetical protein